jgi:hypothetical protein
VLSSDPSAWVTAVSLAVLGAAGDASADESLRALLRRQALNSRLLGDNMMAVDPERPEFRDLVFEIAEAVCGLDVPSVGSRGDGTPSMGDAHDLWSRALVASNAGVIRTSPDPILRLVAAKGLVQYDLPVAVESLGRAGSPGGESDATVREEALAGFERRVGFRPLRGPLPFLALHRDGVMAVDEILRSNSR